MHTNILFVGSNSGKQPKTLYTDKNVIFSKTGYGDSSHPSINQKMLLGALNTSIIGEVDDVTGTCQKKLVTQRQRQR